MRYSYNKNKRKLNYMMLIIMILVISIGYAVLSTNLNITGASTINNPTWDIHWENVSVKTGSVSEQTPTIDTAKTTVNYSVTLTIPGDYYEFTVDVVNAGTIDGMVSVVSNKLNNVEITTLPSYLEYKVTYEDGVDIAPNHLLEAGASEKYKVHVGYKKNINVSDIPATPQTLNLSFSVTYVQSDSNAKEIDHKQIKYSINDLTDYRDENQYVWIGKKISSNIILYDTVEELKKDFLDTHFYLKHYLEYGIVKKSYACFEINNNTYCIQGQQTREKIEDNFECKSEFFDTEANKCLGTYYETNKNTLIEAFNESNCSIGSNSIGCSIDNFGATAADNADIYVYDEVKECYIDYEGNSYCHIY